MGAHPSLVNVVNLSGDVQALTSNAYLVGGAEPTMVDAGSQFDVVGRVEAAYDEWGFEAELSRVVITHTHPDHVDNVDPLRDRFEVETVGFDPESPYVDRTIGNGDTVKIGDHRFIAWHTPGHAGDHLCLYTDGPSVLFSGDLIFANGGIGRTDIPGAVPADLRDSIAFVRDQVGPDLAALYPGHGPAVTDGAYGHVEAAARAAGLS